MAAITGTNGTHKSFETKLFINGQYVDAQSKERLTVRNPVTGEIISDDVHVAGEADIDAAVDAAEAAYKGAWGKFSAKQRSSALLKLADLLDAKGKEIALLETQAMGQPLAVGAWIAPMIGDILRYYAGWTDKIPGEQWPAEEDGIFRFVTYEPFGVCAGIGAWNVSLILFAFKLAPALAAGNTFIFKASEKSPLGCLQWGHLINEAGFPPGTVNIVSGAGTTGALLASHDRIHKISFTGSVPTGKKISQLAAASNLKRVTLELGGKSPALVFEDADIPNAVQTIAQGLLMNSGQACVANSRTFVHESIAPQFIEAIKGAFAQMEKAFGEPTAEGTMFGPMADEAQFNRVMSFIEAGKTEGAELAAGGNRIGETGYLVQPTIFLNAKDDSKIYREEVFGPVLGIRTFKTEEEAIRLANDTTYGLSSVVLTSSIPRALRIAKALEAGTVNVNATHQFGIQAPFGGWKTSGLGREGGKEGIMMYLQSKTVTVNMKVG